MAETFDLRLGRLSFRTLIGDVTEPLGDGLEAVGAVLTAAERRARTLAIELPVAGHRDTATSWAEGQQLRRQVRALLNNAPARMGGLYLQFGADPDLDGWLLVGGGDLSYDGKGPSVGKYKLALTDAYKVGSVRTHRPGYRIEVYDRRAAAVAIDTLGRYFGVEYASVPVLDTMANRATIGVGTSDQVTSGNETIGVAQRAGARGSVDQVAGVAHGTIVHFEQATTEFHDADVVIWDRAGSSTEADWVEVYGPDQEIAAADAPVLDNGLVRARWVGDCRIAVDRWVSGAWVEYGRVTVETASSMPGPFVLTRTDVVEWTPESAVLRLTLVSSYRFTVLVTLRSGWLGPRIEVYQSPSPAPVVARLRWSPANTGSTTTNADNYHAIKDGTLPHYAVLGRVQSDATVMTISNSSAYGTARSTVLTAGNALLTRDGYLSVQVSIAPLSEVPDEGHAALVNVRPRRTLVAR